MTRGHRRTNTSATLAAAAMTCSQLSNTTRRRRSSGLSAKYPYALRINDVNGIA